MPRQKTKGDAIAIRLAVHDDDVFQAIAEARAMTARDLAAEILTEWVHKQKRAQPVAARAAAGETKAHSGFEEFFE